MKILYGIQGTGNGHITRARILNNAFKQRHDIEVDYLFSGRERNKYFDMEGFGHFETKTGLTFVAQNGSINRLETIKQTKLMTFIKDIKSLNLDKYDLVLNDFEPISAWAARLQGKPSLSISHQAAFCHAVPSTGADLIDKFLIKYFAPTRHSLGVHWYHYNQAVIPPFVELGLNAQHSINKVQAYTLVYLPFESIDAIKNTLAPLSEHSFVCFHPDIDSPYKAQNIEWNTPSKSGFQKALGKCKSVIGNAGFELATECISLGKPLLTKPLNGQFEQLSNAKALQDLGLSHTIYQLDTDLIEEWLEKAQGNTVTFPSDPQQLVDWLVAGEWENVQSICEQLWTQVKYPQSVKQKLN
ncbi:glycosyltransferase [Glaciecola sp. MH2013]|uniref:MJ1255/VC2487 family glycosyltransferase n=1 Tax=Glaciecola sp. MH2013 TaxID=2785524 RepID=UPI00189F1BEC|nr:MJ1255/VC2487 family glycosyltransferase [Glaciecola sp. MH2013]MBF7074183.1 glycosyltransferase [Glaciecola sp. MH2013]